MSRARRRSALTLAAVVFLAVAAWGVVHDGRAVAGIEEAPIATVGPASTSVRPARARASRPTRPGTGAVPLAGASDVPRRSAPVAVRPTDVRRAAPRRAGAAPRSVQVLRVPVPASLPARRDVQWTMQPSRRAEVLSEPAGTIAAGVPDSSRAITVVTRVPFNAAAGVLPVGEAEFIVDSASVIVPIELEIVRIRRASVVPGRASFGAVAGQRAQLAVEVRNLGNSIDTVSLRGEMPSGWTSAPSQSVILIPGERKTVVLTTKPPAGMGTTAAYASVQAVIGDSVVGTASLPIQVQDPQERQRSVGPTLTVGASSAFGDTAASSAAFDFALLGQVTDKISVTGRAAYIVDRSTVDRRTLARAGAYLGGSYLSVRGPGWYGTLGNTGATLSTLTGIGVFGKGALGYASRGPLSATALVAGVPNGSDLQAGARADYQFSRTSVGIAASHFADGALSARQLDALGLLGSLNAGKGFRFTAEGAWRQFDGGQGAGAAFSVERTSPRDLFAVTAGHAPGGTQAYGRALNEVTAVAGRRLNDQFSIQGNYFSSSDKPPRLGGEYTSEGWSLSPRYAVVRDVTAELEVRKTTFDSRDSSGVGFGSNELTTSAALRKVGGKWQWLVGGSIGSSDRTTIFSTGPSTFTASRYGVNAGGSVLLPRAVLSAGASYSGSGAGTGYAPRQARVVLGANRIRPFSDLRAPTFRAEAEITSWLGDQPSAVVARIGSEVLLPGDMSLVVDAERNPMIRPTAGSTPWIVAVRLERGFTLGWASRSAMTRGSVFQDRNGNGVRDGDEPGLGGVMVRRGGQTAITDPEGHYALPGTDPVPLEIDPVSLPQGAVAPNYTPANGTRQTNFGVVPTGAIGVRLVPSPDELGRRPESKLSDLAVLARDDRGAEWYLRADSSGTVRFDALPPGRYTFVPDFSGTTERLRQVGDPVILDVKPGENLPPLEIKFSPRSARLFNGGSGTSDQGRRRR